MVRNRIYELYNEADITDIEVMSVDTDFVKSMSVLSETGRCYIGINPFMLKSDADETVCLAHEMGHCVKGAFYNRYSPFDERLKHEKRADIWAIKKLIPKNELKRLYKSGTTDNGEIAEYFGVTEEFLQKALKYYTEK